MPKIRSCFGTIRTEDNAMAAVASVVSATAPPFPPAMLSTNAGV